MVDIVVPVFNCEEFLSDLVLSLERQICRDFFVFFVDDGSTDNSYSVLQNLLSDVSFSHKLIKTTNGGVSSARNLGLESCKSKYVSFLDADDYIDSNHIGFLLAGIEESGADLSFCGFRKTGRTTSLSVSESEGAKVRESVHDLLMNIHKGTQSIALWTSLFRTNLIKANQIKFFEGCRYGEDREFLFKYLCLARSVFYTGTYTYNYRVHETQSTKDSLAVKQLEKGDSILRLLRFLQSNCSRSYVRLFEKRMIIDEIQRSIRMLNFSRDYVMIVQLSKRPEYRKQIRKGIMRFLVKPRILAILIYSKTISRMRNNLYDINR